MRKQNLKIEDFGKRLKRVLSITGTSQKELAIMINTDEQQISTYIVGKKTPRKKRIEEISDVLGVDIDYLINGNEEALQELIEVCKGDDTVGDDKR